MKKQDLGASADAETGSRPTGQAPAGLDASRFDPARVGDVVAGLAVDDLERFYAKRLRAYLAWKKTPEARGSSRVPMAFAAGWDACRETIATIRRRKGGGQ
jgi:hypothetical protein